MEEGRTPFGTALAALVPPRPQRAWVCMWLPEKGTGIEHASPVLTACLFLYVAAGIALYQLRTCDDSRFSARKVVVLIF